jgi:addiction module RelE/StbE family toxin
MTIEYSKSACNQIEKLPSVAQKKIIRKIDLLSQNPLAGKQLQGELSSYRSLRAWPYRILYEIVGKRLIIISVAHRQSVYKH